MELIENRLYLEDEDELNVCRLAVIASSSTDSLKTFTHDTTDLPVSQPETARVLKGLAEVSLKTPNYEYNSLSQHEADGIIRELSGEVDDYFNQVLNDKN